MSVNKTPLQKCVMYHYLKLAINDVAISTWRRKVVQSQLYFSWTMHFHEFPSLHFCLFKYHLCNKCIRLSRNSNLEILTTQVFFWLYGILIILTQRISFYLYLAKRSLIHRHIFFFWYLYISCLHCQTLYTVISCLVDMKCIDTWG